MIAAPVATGVVRTDVAHLQAALNAVPGSGGILIIPAGTYFVSTSLFVHSNTHILCTQGVTIKAAATWDGGRQFLFTNPNYDALSLTDHDITVEGCSFDFTGSNIDNGGAHAMNFRMVSRVKVNRVNCTNGGDCTALLATSDTVVENSSASGIKNACWDAWDAPAHGRVVNNYCMVHGGNGILVTGTNTGNATAGVATDFVVEENMVVADGTAAGAGIWANGLGLAGSGASRVLIARNHINNGGGLINCLKVSGGGTGVLLTDNICTGGDGGHAAIVTGTDESGSFPTNTRISGGLIENYNSGTDGLIVLGGTGDSINGVKIAGGQFAFDIVLSGTNQFVANNILSTTGSIGAYHVTGSGVVIIPPRHLP
jgi:hypothetical protein